MSIPNTPIVNAGLLYANGLRLEPTLVAPYNTGKFVLIEPGLARDSTNINDIYLPQAVDTDGDDVVVGGLAVGAIINGLQVGANGVDQAALVANSLYAVYVIASSTSVFTSTTELSGGPSPNPLGPIAAPAPANPYPAAGLLSLAQNAVPVLPFGYDMYRRIGWVSTDGSANILKFHQFISNDQSRYYWYDVPRALGAATTGSTTYVKAPLVAAATPTTSPYPFLVPAKASQVFLNVSLTANAAGDAVQFLPYGATSTGAGIVQFVAPVVSPAIAVGSVSVPCGVDSVDYPTVNPVPVPVFLYKTTSASDVLVITVCGFLDLL